MNDQDDRREGEDFDAYLLRKYGPPSDTMLIRQIGTILQAGKGGFRRVKWEDGQVETFNDVPGLADLNKGQRFEAMVTRTAWKNQYERGWDFISMADVKAIEPLPEMTEEESKALWDSIPSTASLPPASWG